jgi:hypothetical protein
MNEEQVPKRFPHYPTGIPVASSKDAGMLAKIVGKSIKARFHPRSKKGIAANQSIHIGKRKTKFY